MVHPGDSSKAGHVIDFILVNRKFRNSILDSRVYRGNHLQSDHSLVVAKIRVKLEVMEKKEGSFKASLCCGSLCLRISVRLTRSL